ncbi:putative MFS transporter [Acrodontium crateriforme]|uniref:MFS transporter n=1 Tax=Acrodontium crateriforme TaxID=150365 RepID=A0AAQ3RA55_9PEZI|nr:putative MFS transporter [Acrodontium crateriforme]
MDSKAVMGANEPDNALKSTMSITSDGKGATIVTKEDGEILTIDPKAERSLVWKLDIRLLPLLALMYLFNSLDKTNLGNAKTAGLEADLGMKGTNKYNIILSVFYIPYVLGAPFIAILGKYYGPSRVLPCMMVTFGTMTLLVVTVKNFGGILVLRIILGLAESAFFPLVIYYQTMFYRRLELARRLAIFYAASNIAGAFGGLLAYGVFHIHGGALQNWRYLFLIEGSLSIIMAVIAYIFLPRSVMTASFLNEEEKKLAFYRIQVDSSAVVDEKFNLRQAAKILAHPTSWVILLIEICLGIPLQSVSLFLPQIIARLGYSTVKTNLYTVAPNVTGAMMLLILAFASDFTKWRFPFIAAGFFFSFCGFVIYSAIDVKHSLHIAYFATFMMCWGTSAPSVLLDVWYNNNIPDENRRVFLTSIGVPLANVMGIVASNIFRPQDAPQYIPALATTATFGAVGIVLTLGLGFYMIFDNRRRDRRQGVKLRPQDVPTERLRDGPNCSEFRWMY